MVWENGCNLQLLRENIQKLQFGVILCNPDTNKEKCVMISLLMKIGIHCEKSDPLEKKHRKV